MAINYDSLPSVKPQSTLPEGFYKAKIAKAEMKVSNNTGNSYLSIQYDLSNDKGQTGKLFDMLMESEKEFLRYKLQRFINALQLNLAGTFELKDLCKLINGKQLIVDVGTEDNDRYGKRNVINSFGHEIYYPVSEWASLTSVSSDPLSAVEDDVPAPSDADAPIQAADALDNNEEY